MIVKGRGVFARATPAKLAGQGPFARVETLRTRAPAPRTEEETRRQSAWVSRAPLVDESVDDDDLDVLRAQNICDELERLGWPDALVFQLREMRPDRWYVVTLVVEGYSAAMLDASAPSSMGSGARRTMTFVGRGRALLSQCLALSHSVDVVDGWVAELQGGIEDEVRPLWRDDQITLADGTQIYGTGGRSYPEQRRGRKRKRYGRLTYAEGKRRREAERKAKARARATQAKIALLSRTDPEAAYETARRRKAAVRGYVNKHRAHNPFARAKPKERK